MDAVNDAIKRVLAKEEKVSLVSLGMFSMKKRARIDRNLQIGATIESKTQNVSVLLAGKGLKDAVS